MSCECFDNPNFRISNIVCFSCPSFLWCMCMSKNKNEKHNMSHQRCWLSKSLKTYYNVVAWKRTKKVGPSMEWGPSYGRLPVAEKHNRMNKNIYGSGMIWVQGHIETTRDLFQELGISGRHLFHSKGLPSQPEVLWKVALETYNSSDWWRSFFPQCHGCSLLLIWLWVPKNYFGKRKNRPKHVVRYHIALSSGRSEHVWSAEGH